MHNAHHQPAATVVALFGGSFDPPHIAHQQIPIYLLENHLVDQVWYVPVKHHPLGKVVSSDADRLQMLQLMVESLRQRYSHFSNQIKIEEWELQQEEPSYSLKTLDAMSDLYPDFVFKWVIGTDNLSSFHRWYQFQTLLDHYEVLVYPRQGYTPDELRTGMTFLKNAPEVTVSSTEVRQKVKAKQALHTSVLPTVAEYIAGHHLYQ